MEHVAIELACCPLVSAKAADAERARHIALMEKHAPPPALAVPPQRLGSDTPPRVRGL